MARSSEAAESDGPSSPASPSSCQDCDAQLSVPARKERHGGSNYITRLADIIDALLFLNLLGRCRVEVVTQAFLH
jgi:hypothetical protein